MWVNGDYRAGISVMDRHLARAAETLKVAKAMVTWADQLNPSAAVAVTANIPSSATAVGLTEAPRGALGHWLRISNGRISRYQIITPTCWNASPRDSAARRGPLEQALIGTPVRDVDQPIEVQPAEQAPTVEADRQCDSNDGKRRQSEHHRNRCLPAHGEEEERAAKADNSDQRRQHPGTRLSEQQR